MKRLNQQAAVDSAQPATSDPIKYPSQLKDCKRIINAAGSQCPQPEVTASPRPSRQMVMMSSQTPKPPCAGAKTETASWSSVCRQRQANPVSRTDVGGPNAPIIVSLTDGVAQARFPPKQRPLDTARHVTFADQPNGGNRHFGSGHQGSGCLGRYQGRWTAHGDHQQRFDRRDLQRTPAEPGLQGRQPGSVPLPRTRIGSGRFNDRTRPPFGELWAQQQRYRQREAAAPSRSQPAEWWYGGESLHGHHGPASSYSGAHAFSRGVVGNLQACGNGNRVQAAPPGLQRGPYGGCVERGHTGQSQRGRPNWHVAGVMEPEYYSDPQVWVYRQHPATRAAFLPTRRQYDMGRQPGQPPSYFHSRGFPFGERRAGHDDLNGARGEPEFRYRRPAARLQPVANSSSDQSDTSFQTPGVRYPSAQRFRRVSRPINESETETSLGSVTFQSETSNNESVPEVSSKNGTGEGASESTEHKNVQISSAPKQPLRVRRGYIQIGLGDSSKPQFLRSVSDPNA